MFSVMLNCPSKLFLKNADASRPHCWHVPQPTDFSGGRTCNCKKSELPSSTSSASLTSDSFPIGNHKMQRNPTSRIDCLQNHEHFYSCSSDESDSDEELRRSPRNKRIVFLELLKKVMNLIRHQESTSSVVATSKSVVKGKQLQNKSTSITLLSPLVYSQQPHCCCSCRMADIRLPPYNIPYLQRFNLGVSTAATGQIPESFVSKESEITEDQTPVKSSGMSSKIPFCPPESQGNELVQYNREDNKVQSDLLELEQEYVDEELHPLYVDKILTEPFALHGPTADSLMEYDDEEPVILEHILYEEIHPFLAQVLEVAPSEVHESQPFSVIQHDEEKQICTVVPPIVSKTIHVRSREISNTKLEENKIIDEIIKNIEISSEVVKETEENRVSYLLHSSTTTGRHIYNYSPDNDKLVKPGHLISYNQSSEEEEEEQKYDNYGIDNKHYELDKEKISESRKRKAQQSIDPVKDTSLAKLKQVRDEAAPAEMKFFIDSLIMDLNAMDYARRNTQFEKNICRRKIGLCNRPSFPVTITDVTDLGASSLYVKWKIHDCFGIDGYEIYTDGYLTNRYYNSRHDSAVITQVDVTLPHKIALVAKPCSTRDDSFESLCTTTATKTEHKFSSCNTVVAKELASHTALWTPSIFLYDPIACGPNPKVPPIMSDNF